MQGYNSPISSPETPDVLYYKIEGKDGVSFAKTRQIVENAIQKKWDAEIKNTDMKGKAIFLEFPHKIRKDTIQRQLEVHRYRNYVTVSATRTFITARDKKNMIAAKRKLDRDLKTNVTTHYQISPLHPQMTFHELLDILNNTIVKKWFARIVLQDEEEREIFLSFPKRVEQAIISTYLRDEKLSGILKVEHIYQVPDQESRKRFKAIQKKYRPNDSQFFSA